MNLENAFLNWLVGGDASEDRTPKLEWINAPESWGVFVLIGVVVAILFGVVWLYTREIETCPRPVKWLLAGLRFSVLMLLVIVFLKPSITYVEKRIRKPNIVLLRDASQSMDREDAYRNATVAKRVAAAMDVTISQVQEGNTKRVKLLNTLLSKDQFQFLQDVRRKGSVRIIDFSDSTNKVDILPALQHGQDPNQGLASDPSSVTNVSLEGSAQQGSKVALIPDLTADGRATDIWQALKEALNVGQLASIVLLTDGQHTSLDQPLEVAELAKAQGIPIYVVGVGDPSRPKNIAVSDIYVLSKARPDEPFEIDTLVTGHDVQGETVQLELIQQTINSSDGQPGTEQTIKSKQITFKEESEVIRERFTHQLAQPGKYIYRVRIQPIANEDEASDNEKTSAILEVTDEKVKVLLIAGAPTWEYRMVQRLLQRDQQIILSCWLQTMDSTRVQEGNDPISVLPQTYEELAKYNVIMLFDPDTKEFDEGWLDALKKFTDQKSGGVLYMAGPKHTSMFLSLQRTRGIRDLLPVKFSKDGSSPVAQLLAASNTRATPLNVVLPNADHQLMSFYPDRRENLNRWQSLPGVYWSYPAVSGKATSRVLLEHSDVTLIEEGDQLRPLLVAGRYGAGNTVYIGFNGTWRWRRVGVQAEFFDKFWIQTVRYLVNTRSQGARRGTIDAGRDEYELGDTVEFTARLLDPRYEPLQLPEVSAVLRRENDLPSHIKLKQMPGSPGEYRASFTARKTGQYALQVELRGAKQDQVVEEVSFRVKPPSVETKAYWLNETLLRQIAETSGGKYYHVDEIEQLPLDLPETSEEVEWRSRPEPIWDVNQYFRLFCFCLPVLLLAVEWAVRKGFKLL